MISVVTCTHNPREAFLSRVAEGLRAQTLHTSQWEWIIVDNLSRSKVSSWLDVGWHQSARILVEPELGLTPARLRGIRETRHEQILFVDDDNILSPTYLESVACIFEQHKNLGAIGGSTDGEFEVPVPDWFTEREYEMLGIRSLDCDKWGRHSNTWDICPIGAGMAVRKSVADEYTRQLETEADASRRKMDRCGDSLVSAGDIDLATTSFCLGLGVGRFCSLNLIHLIPEERIAIDYLERLAEGIGYSGQQMCLLNESLPQEDSRWWPLRIKWIRSLVIRIRRARQLKRIDQAYAAGKRLSIEDWRYKNA